MDAQGDNLLTRLVEQERSLAGKVDQARKEADEIVAEAERKAREILTKASERADAVAQEHREAGASEAEAERDEILAAARKDVEALAGRSDANRRRAAELVLERVLP